MNIGKLGVWAALDGPICFFENDRSAELGRATAPRIAEFARRIETLGYSHVWFPEGFGRNSLVTASWLLANTTKLIVATGIATIYARDPMAMRGGADALNEQSGGRFVLGLGVSHREAIEGMRGHDYSKPLTAMRTYLDAYEAAPYMAATPAAPTPIVLAALREKMIALSGTRTQGAHTYNVTPEHTATARSILGPDKWLCVEQPMILEPDGAKARKIARGELELYLGLENYRNSWRSMGFEDADFENGGSDRFIDGTVGWGDENALRARIDAHLQAGASQVCIKALSADGGTDMRILECLAPQQG
ncbi:TIGR03620 family F420-dependent LLM class oxidoreductase [Sphingobium tyrosinilyticum]|uniref:TIGR03620 family F420-dependent LLM class oxidoreductase n=1 Tax=Sphingobium tyrosinilyticum TaxID=2715436 RepID=A0ABV9EZW1_9SPHN